MRMSGGWKFLLSFGISSAEISDYVTAAFS
jgi:hypothetical protein